MIQETTGFVGGGEDKPFNLKRNFVRMAIGVSCMDTLFSPKKLVDCFIDSRIIVTYEVS